MKSPLNERRRLNIFGFTKRLLVIGVFCLLFSPLGAFAKTLAEYRASVHLADTSTKELLTYVEDVFYEDREANPEYERKLLAAIRNALPVTEKVEWEGTSVDTGNQWLEAKLKAFEEDPKDQATRQSILTDIGERLAALEEKLKQLENPALTDRSKDEDKQKLAEILRRIEFQKPQKQEESWAQKLLRKIREWFQLKAPQPDIPVISGLESLSLVMQILLYALLFAFIAFVIYRFAPFFANKFRRREKKEKEDRIILGEKLAADEDARSIFSEAEEMARNGNLRGAIRKGYIALLCELSDRKIIGLAQHKTNRDYLRDVHKKRELHREMNGLTNSFERHWYGFDETDENDWNEFKQAYQKAISND